MAKKTLKDYEAVRDRARSAAATSKDELQVALEELADLILADVDMAKLAVALQDITPKQFQALLKALLLGNPSLLHETMMTAGVILDDAYRVFHEEGRGYRQDAKVMLRARKDMMRSAGEIMRTDALERYDELLGGDDDDEDVDDDCD